MTTVTWQQLFDRARDYSVTEEAIREALAERRERDG